MPRCLREEFISVTASVVHGGVFANLASLHCRDPSLKLHQSLQSQMVGILVTFPVAFFPQRGPKSNGFIGADHWTYQSCWSKSSKKTALTCLLYDSFFHVAPSCLSWFTRMHILRLHIPFAPFGTKPWSLNYNSPIGHFGKQHALMHHARCASHPLCLDEFSVILVLIRPEQLNDKHCTRQHSACYVRLLVTHR